MKFEEGERYRHDRSMDVDIFVVAIKEEKPESVLMAVFFVNQTSGKMVSPDEITVKTEDFGNWKKIES